MRVSVRVSGERACFRRPECREDFVSYDMMTPLAALRLLEGVDSRTPDGWTVDSIDVLRPVQFGWITSAEAGNYPARRINALFDVEYIIHARRSRGMTEDDGWSVKPAAFLGLRECPATVSTVKHPPSVPSLAHSDRIIDLGWMVYDLRGRGQSKTRFFRASLVDGRLTVPLPEDADLAI